MRRYTSVIGIVLSLLSVSGPALASDSSSALTVNLSHAEGHDMLHVSGQGPVSTVIRLHTVNMISRDLPEVAIGDRNGYKDVMSNGNGDYETDIPLAGSMWQNTLIRVDAMVPDRHMRISKTMVLGVTSAATDIKAVDVLPKK